MMYSGGFTGWMPHADLSDGVPEPIRDKETEPTPVRNNRDALGERCYGCCKVIAVNDERAFLSISGFAICGQCAWSAGVR